MDKFNERFSLLKQDTGDRIEELIHNFKVREMLAKNEEEEKTRRVIVTVFALLGIIAAIAGIAYAVYRFVTPDYLEDYEDDFDDDFLDSIEDETKTEAVKAEE